MLLFVRWITNEAGAESDKIPYHPVKQYGSDWGRRSPNPGASALSQRG